MSDTDAGRMSVRAEGAKMLASYLEDAILSGRLGEGVWRASRCQRRGGG